jgi:hypothetical protein
MSGDAGGRQDVAGDELRALADKAATAASNVTSLRDRVGFIVAGVDRRGWNAAPFDAQWASTRAGLSAQGVRFDQAQLELLARSLLADLLNSRGIGIGPDGLPLQDPVNSFSGNLLQRVTT